VASAGLNENSLKRSGDWQDFENFALIGIIKYEVFVLFAPKILRKGEICLYLHTDIKDYCL
jgi:hypothetical protein